MDRILSVIVKYIEDNGIPNSIVDYPDAYFDNITGETFLSVFVADISCSNKCFEYNMYAMSDMIKNLGYDDDPYTVTIEQVYDMWK